jgi:hypothetical protein
VTQADAMTLDSSSFLQDGGSSAQDGTPSSAQDDGPSSAPPLSTSLFSADLARDVSR